MRQKYGIQRDFWQICMEVIPLYWVCIGFGVAPIMLAHGNLSKQEQWR